MLNRVVRPDGQAVAFTYDALGRRLSKSFRGRTTRWVWDGDTPLHEWVETDLAIQARHTAAQSGTSGGSALGEEVVTWLFEPNSFAPLAKVVGSRCYDIITDHLGTPLSMHTGSDEAVWSAELNSYGEVMSLRGKAEDCPFRYPGQYEDGETGLYYNRFRYYNPEDGMYISQDPIRLMGNNPNIYAYVKDTNDLVDIFGLSTALPSKIIALAEKNITNTGQTVLGHFPEYIDKAKRMNASYYDIGDAWNDLDPDQRWAANKHFLDKIASREDQILLSHSKGNIRKGSYLEREVNTLIDKKGYKWVNQWSLKKKCNK